MNDQSSSPVLTDSLSISPEFLVLSSIPIELSNMEVTKVFSIAHVLENILSHVEGGIIRNLNLRLVSKAFNTEILRNIKENHIKMKIEYIGERFDDLHLDLNDTDPDVAERIQSYHNTDFRVFINNDKFKLAEIDGYFKFIKLLENVTIERITVKNLWKLTKSMQRDLHDSIVNSLIGNNYSNLQSLKGLDELCSGCSSCAYLSKQTEKCATQTSSEFLSFHEHFKSLIMSDTVIQSIFEYSQKLSRSEEECLYNFNRFTKSFITCDHLILSLSEDKVLLNKNFDEDQLFDDDEFFDNDENASDHHHLPRELVETIIKKWKVKSIGIKFVNETLDRMLKDLVDKNNWMTKLKLNAPSDSVKKSKLGLKFERVDVDLSDSEKCAIGITHNNSDWKHYKNLIANIRKEFPTDQISITFSHWMQKSQVDIQEVFNNIVKTIHKEEQKDLKVFIRYYADAKSFIHVNPLTTQEELIEFPSSIRFKCRELDFSVENHPMHCSVRGLSDDGNSFVEKKKVGRRCNIVDSRNNCIIHLDVFIDDKDINTLKNQIKSNQMSFFQRLFRSL